MTPLLHRCTRLLHRKTAGQTVVSGRCNTFAVASAADTPSDLRCCSVALQPPTGGRRGATPLLRHPTLPVRSSTSSQTTGRTNPRKDHHMTRHTCRRCGRNTTRKSAVHTRDGRVLRPAPTTPTPRTKTQTQTTDHTMTTTTDQPQPRLCASCGAALVSCRTKQ